jgi:uncharacterized surface protein with fasciclin (FAS1) repeats
MKVRSNRSIALAAAGVVLALPALTACGGSSDTASTGTDSSASSTPSESSSGDAMASGAAFGAGCAAVPTSGSGSFDGMAADPVATAASHNPVLSTLVEAVGAAKLGDTLNSAQDITVFAPTNDAFKAMDQATLTKAMGDPNGLLKTVLTYHVVPGKLTPEQLAGTHKTLEGDTLTVKGSGEDFTVDGGAKVVCGDVQTANATVYIIDGVLAPKM